MNCKNCGTPLNENHKFCLNCGVKVELPTTDVIVAPVAETIPEVVDVAIAAPVIEVTEPSMVEAIPEMTEPIVVESIPEMNGIPTGTPVTLDQVVQTQDMHEQPQPSVKKSVESGIIEYGATGLPVGKPVVEQPVPEVQPLNNGGVQPVSTGTEVPVIPPVQIIPGAPVANMPGYVQQQPVAPMPPMPPAPKKDNKKLFIIIGGIVLVVIAVVVVLLLVLGKDKEEAKDTNNKDNDTSTNVPEKEPEKESEKEPEQEPVLKPEEQPVTPTGPTYEVKFGNFIFNIPNEYQSKNVNNEYISLTNDTYYFELVAIEGESYLTVNPEDLTAYFEGEGFKVISSTEKLVNGTAYLVVHVENNGTNSVYIYTKSTAYYYGLIFGVRNDFTYSDELVEEMIDILEDIDYSSSGTTPNSEF